MTPLEFTLAVLLLLGTPGPTNTLLSLSGAGTGIARSLPLLAGELSGYLLVIVPVAIFAAPLLESRPAIGLVLRFAATCWIVVLAVRLLRMPASGTADAHGPVTIRQVLVTTLLNPKAMIIALTIMPHGSLAQLLPWISGFALITLCAGSSWIVLGARVFGAHPRLLPPQWLRRIAACCLIVFAFILAGSLVDAGQSIFKDYFPSILYSTATIG